MAESRPDLTVATCWSTWVAVMWVAAALPGAALGGEPPDATSRSGQPVGSPAPGELDKVADGREARVVGREENGNTFRRPGSILERARTGPRPADPEQLAARYKAMYGGRTFTHALAGPPAEATETPVRPAAESGAPPVGAGGPRAAPLAALGAAVALVFAAGGWLLVRWRAASVRPPAAAQPAPPGAAGDAPRRRGGWLKRDVKITMGARDT